MIKKSKAVLFDLDGTLLDTAPDLVFTLNLLRKEVGLPAVSVAEIRPSVGLGSKEMLRLALNIEETHPDFKSLREKFLDLYQQHLADHTQFFPQIENVLDELDQRDIAWGIVTNKLTRHTHRLLKALQFDRRAECVVCGDTLIKYKPDPLPITHACSLLNQKPATCLYVGDAATDVIASKAAGTRSIVALYGYIDGTDPYAWQADGYITEPHEILNWV